MALAAACQGIAACASQDLWPQERLDPRTAVHATILAEPWVYAHEAPMLAAHARDYLNIGIVETNRAGDRAYWLGLVAWSTIDRRLPAGSGAPPGRVRLLRRDTPIELVPVAGGRDSVGLDDPVFAGPAQAYSESWYSLSVEQLRQLADAPPQAVELWGEEEAPVRYEAWRVRQRPMTEFMNAVGL